ncbi:hypothetical protein [Brachybacterium aquaticum]|uniref:Uncharacterized protein n=1 Tax=Brachybacterium aquaticum TaxID=1432564 RepID=A0A841AFX4_9MICO|nr:hypothetical protein [Brachybacterium aquaticum]MBB5831958.1 hypothetical protein [Brachybacterium aquaticum]
MSTPLPPPRHLPHRDGAGPAGLRFGRQAARIRAIVNADLLPEERAEADALVLTAWLTTAQRERYAPTLRAGHQVDEFAQRLADERRVVLEEGTDPVADEADSVAAAERAARQVPLRIVEAVLLLVAAACFALTVASTFRTSDRSIPQDAGPLLATLLVAALLAAAVGMLATSRRDRMLLDWAVSRPGQLGRGLPVRRPLQSDSAGPAIVRSLGPALLLGLGIISIVAGSAILLISLMVRIEVIATDLAPVFLIGGVVCLVTAVVLVHLNGRRVERVVRRARAIEWIGPESGLED